MSIQNIVVLMLENRSFDNVLGGLYGPDNLPPYQTAPTGQAALAGISATASNPGLDGSGPVFAHNQTGPTSVGAAGPTYSPTTIPLVDPGEFFCDMSQQLLGLQSVPLSPPWSGYSPTGPSACQGYVLNYSQLGGTANLMFALQAAPPAYNYPDVMNYLTPAQLPVSAFLARNYGLSDEWFGSVPSQTYVNRSFALSAAPAVTGPSGPSGAYSFIDDAQYFDTKIPPQLVSIAELPSILSQLDEAPWGAGVTGPHWKVYFHDYSIAYDTLQYVRAAVAAGAGRNVGTYDDSDWGSQTPTQLGSSPVASSFVDDVKNGTLPPFSWIEPRYFDNYAQNPLPPNSNHPGSAWTPLGNLLGNHVPIDATTGELLLMEVYNLLRGSGLWETTLLIVTYDEHGGVWDGVAPPYAAPPGGAVPAARFDDDPAANGFNYTVFGGRVPTIVASPMVPQGTLFRAPAGGPPFDHTSIITTVRDLILAPLGATAPLTGRDAAAPSLAPGLTASPVNDTGFFVGTLMAGPSSLYFLHHHGTLAPPAQVILAGADPGVPLQASVAEPAGGGWLGVSPTDPTTTGIFTVTVDPTGLAEQPYFGTLEIVATGATAATIPPCYLPVTLDVVPLF
jgi:phospholipase C